MQIVKFYNLRFNAEDLPPGSGDASKLAMAPALVNGIGNIFNPWVLKVWWDDIEEKNEVWENLASIVISAAKQS